MNVIGKDIEDNDIVQREPWDGLGIMAIPPKTHPNLTGYAIDGTVYGGEDGSCYVCMLKQKSELLYEWWCLAYAVTYVMALAKYEILTGVSYWYGDKTRLRYCIAYTYRDRKERMEEKPCGFAKTCEGYFEEFRREFAISNDIEFIVRFREDLLELGLREGWIRREEEK